MAKQTYEVRVEFEGVEYYEVQAESETEAMANWALGDLTGTDGHSYGAVKATPYFEDDNYEEVEDAEPDEY